MSDSVIVAENLSKIYRLYAKPHHRILDMFGLLPAAAGKYTEYPALKGVSLAISRGERVAIIGRNGAGKSTLLKLVTRVIEPTGGFLSVKGGVHALLQIGTGFHPDFTGRENVYSYLAHLGVTGEPAHQKLEEIIEFAEIEDFIDQPLKTYSTGMGARLMFATSTAISPDILVIDEVLSVGDAYFVQKSFDKITELCTRQKTTLLLVTHDVYSAAKLCDRFIWLDKGVIKADASAKHVVAIYEESIRAQEEARLSLKRLRMMERNSVHQPDEEWIHGTIRVEESEASDVIVAFSHASFRCQGREVALIDFATERQESAFVVTDMGAGNWGESEVIEGRTARRLLRHGSIFHALPFMVRGRAFNGALAAHDLEVEVGCYASARASAEMQLVYGDGRDEMVADIPLAGEGVWQDIVTRVRIPSPARLRGNSDQRNRYGNRKIEIQGVDFLDAQGNPCHAFTIGSALRIRLTLAVHDCNLQERPVFVCAFQKDGTTRTHRFSTDQILISGSGPRQKVLEVTADPLLLGAGTYLVTVSIFQEGYFSSLESKKFFSANHGVYDMHARGYEIIVLPSPTDPLANDVVFIHPCKWRSGRDSSHDLNHE